LTGKVALVTGGAVRVGRAIALALADAGADVAIGYRRSSADAKKTVTALKQRGVRAVALSADLARPAEARALPGRAAARLGRLDLLVNSAAIFPRTPFASTTPAQYDRVMDVNLRGAFFCAQGAARAMGQRGGRIVNIADASGTRAWPTHLPYGLSKAGIIALTRSLAAALAPRITVNAVGPGVVLLRNGSSRKEAHRLAARVPMGRLGSPEDVAAAVVFFATCPDYITGQVLFVDGGASTR
jgi:NAD(P)-dependent dehydrogenase (short-subunit alcohol dehydrogenase family)